MAGGGRRVVAILRRERSDGEAKGGAFAAGSPVPPAFRMEDSSGSARSISEIEPSSTDSASERTLIEVRGRSTHEPKLLRFDWDANTI